jgi:signal transduction histidine kinase
MTRRTLLVTYIATYILAITAVIRTLVIYPSDRFLPLELPFTAYLVLLFLEPFYIRRNRQLTLIYLIVQTGIICTIAYFTPEVDYWASLFAPLVVQVMHNFPQRTGFLITSIFTVVMSIFILSGFGLDVGLPLVLVYTVVYFLLAAFIAIIREAETARQASLKQQTELKIAHQQLQVYTEQAEELAVLQERNRVARSLHDSVTQTLFTLNLSAESVRILIDRDILKAKKQLDEMQDLAKSALFEMRSLIFELRPTAAMEVGLVPALRQHAIILNRQHGLKVLLLIPEEPEISKKQAQQLFRITQEALNNVVKHAQTDKATVQIIEEPQRLKLIIEDQGKGFTPIEVNIKGKNIGLSSMRERAEMIGGTLLIDSKPGEGTRVSFDLTLRDGDTNNG